MSQKKIGPTQINRTEYSVYVFPRDEDRLSLPKWKKAGSTCNARRAIKHAKLLRHKNEYHRIEVKKYFYSEAEKKRVGKTIRVFESHTPHINKFLDVFSAKKAA